MKLTKDNSISRHAVLLCAAIFSVGACTHAEPVKKTESGSPSAERTKWFVDASYGMFIHWGPYSEAAGKWNGKYFYGTGESPRFHTDISLEEYDEFCATFNPVKFNADEWVAVAKAAGMRYITFTSKHSDGFAMFHSKASPHNIVDMTPFKRDPIKELAEACEKENIKLCLYYSQYFDRWGPTGNSWRHLKERKMTPEEQDALFLEYYENKCKPQVKEILTGYGPIGMVWFDGRGLTKEQALEVVDLIHTHQPGCLISERIRHDLGEVKGYGDSEFPKEYVNKPAEAIFTHNDTWGYIERDNNWKSSKEIIHRLVMCKGKGANFMLNVGPKGDGTFPELAVDILKRAGKWIKKHEESIYGAAHSPFPELSWGECSHRPGKLYLHVLEWPLDLKLRVPSIADNAKSLNLLASGKKVKFIKDGNDIIVNLPARCPDLVNTVIVVNYEGELNIDPVPTLMENFKLELDAYFAKLYGKAEPLGFYYKEEFGSWYKADIVNRWSSESDYATWQFRAPRAGLYFVELDYSYPSSSPKREGLIMIDDSEKLYFECKSTGDQRQFFQPQPVGVIRVSKPGYHKISIRPTGEGEEFIKLRTLKISTFE